MSPLARFSSKTISWLFYGLFFFVPLVLWPKTSEVFEFNKMLLTYGFTTLIIVFWLIKSFTIGKLVIRRTPLDIPILLFLISQVASTIMSISPHTSIWGYYSRFHGGLTSTISYILLYYAYVSNETDLQFSIHSLLSSAILVSLYGILEHFGIDKNLWIQDVQSRVFSTFGQPNWLSAYLVALIPLPIFLGLSTKNKKLSLLYLLTALLFFITIIFTKSKSGIGTTFIVLTICTIIISIQKKSWLVPLVSIFALASLLLLNPTLLQDTQNAFLKTIHFNTGINKDKEINRYGGSDSFDIRKVVWKGAIELGKKYPVFGTGVETFGYSYYWVRPVEHNYLSEWEFLYNKAHNEYLNLLANTGFLGLGSYLLLIGWIIFWWIKSISASSQRTTTLALLLGFISILITNYFGFSVVMIGIFFFIFPALIISTQKPYTITVNLPSSSIFAPLMLAILAFYLLNQIINSFTADLHYSLGKNLLQVGYIPQAVNSLTQATKQLPNEPTFWGQLAEAQAQAVVLINQQLLTLPASTSAATKSEGEKIRQEFFNQALDSANKAVSLNHYDPNMLKSKAKTELILGSYQPELVKAGLQSLLELQALAPTDPKILYNIALVYQNLGQTDQAKLALQKAIDLKSDYQAAINLLTSLNQSK